MKTIFRYTNIALLTAAIFAAGAMAIFAQDACADTAGQTALYDTFLAKFPTKTIEGRKAFIEIAKQFVDKYGACDTTKENTTYFKDNIPKWEAAVKKMEEQAIKDALVKRFDGAITAKNWDEVYASGKEILQKYPEEFRTVEIVLASVGGEEAFNANFKYADDAIRYAKVSISDLEGGKSFMVNGKEVLGLFAYSYKTRTEAVGWMNLYIGYITQVAKRNKAEAAPYLYKASQSSSDAAKNPVSFELIGAYYFEELNKVVEKIQTAIKGQSDTDAPDVAAKKVEDIKALVAMSNGISERAMDAFSRAYTLSTSPAAKAKMKKNVVDAYKVRFAKETGVEEWIATAVAKPFVNPTTPVAPISDPEPTSTTGNAGTGIGAANGTGTGAANGTGIGAAKGTGMGGATGTGIGGAKPVTTTNVVAKPASVPAKTAPVTKTAKPATPSKGAVAKRKTK
ncbi:MAG: hypothetical protein ABL999_08915 [Pyrinomonadaceae bacterium]